MSSMHLLKLTKKLAQELIFGPPTSEPSPFIPKCFGLTSPASGGVPESVTGRKENKKIAQSKSPVPLRTTKR